MRKTLVLPIDSQMPVASQVSLAATIIRKGGLVAFPTETVYGLGADALNAKTMLELFQAKNRPLDNPPIIHVANPESVRPLVKNMPSEAERLMRRFWPGPLTLVFERSPVVPSVTVAGLDTIAIRMPRHNVALALLRDSRCPIAAPSANLAGKPSPTSARDVLEDLDGRIDAVLDAGPTDIGVESTVLDLTVDPPELLRPGGTPYEALVSFLSDVKLNPIAIADKPPNIGKPRSPGMKHRHYAPKAEMIVVEGTTEAVVRKMSSLVKAESAKGRRVGVLATDETRDKFSADVVKSVGSQIDLTGVARNLFRKLREFDSEAVDVIVAEGVSTQALGLAVMNRLRKAAGYNIVKVE